MNTSYPQCALCPYEWTERVCRTGKGKGPKNCPTLRMRSQREEALNLMSEDPALLKFACKASEQEAAGYGNREKGFADIRPIKPRILEIAEFASGMGYKRLGLSFCGGLGMEARIVHRFYEDKGFEVASFMCKAGATPKSAIGVAPENCIEPGAEHETMCNPVFQALAANAAEVDFNILLGLCVGHDSLFIKFARAPITVLAVKDRLLAHNPLAAVYQMDQYYRYLKNEKV